VGVSLCKNKIGGGGKKGGKGRLTDIKCISATTERKLIRSNNTNIHRQQRRSKPPPNRVTQEVNLRTRIIVRPEADTPQQERPMERLARIRMAARQGVIVVEHSALDLEPLLQKRHRLHLSLLALEPRAVLWDGGYLVDEPDVGGLRDVLVAVDLLLLVCPVWERGGVGPHGDFGGVVDEFELCGEGFEFLVWLAVLDADLEEGVVVAGAVGVVEGNGGEFLVGWVVGGGDVVGEEDGVCDDVAELDEVVVAHDAVEGVLAVGGEDLPVVVGVVEGVAGNLLSLAGDTSVIVTKRVFIRVTVEVCLGLLVSEHDVVKVVNRNRIGRHEVITQRLLELGRHEVITRARLGEDGEVNLEPEEVEQERDEDETERAGGEVLAEIDQRERALATVDIEKIPEVNGDSSSDSEEGEGTDILGGDNAAERKASEKEPLPPLPSERLVSQLIEPDIAEQTTRHRKDERRIQKNQSRLSNMRVIKQHQASGNNARRQGVSRFPHDIKHDRNSESAEQGRHGAESDVGDFVGDIRVPDVLEVEVSIITHEPSHQREQQLPKRWVDIEEVCALEVVRRELCITPLVSSLLSPPPSSLLKLLTFPKCTSSNTTSFGWLIPQNLVAKARTVMITSASL
jgi:hypothetical protein